VFGYAVPSMALWQRSLFDLGDEVEVGLVGPPDTRMALGGGAWIEYRPEWNKRQDLLFEHLVGAVPWRLEERPMYDRTVVVPRKISFYEEQDELPHPALAATRHVLNRHYGTGDAGELCTTGLCLYRDGRDSVAWHSDRIGQHTRSDTLVAIISLGARRTFLIRPASGGPALRHHLGAGDLLVMGGRFQQTWEHCVPKTMRPVGPRISVQFRTRGAR
jgi:alkylated DNA repair dioxygenase AlkB